MRFLLCILVSHVGTLDRPSNGSNTVLIHSAETNADPIEHESCILCLDDAKLRLSLDLFGCTHKHFHKDCLREYLRHTIGNCDHRKISDKELMLKCPICRREAPLDNLASQLDYPFNSKKPRQRARLQKLVENVKTWTMTTCQAIFTVGVISFAINEMAKSCQDNTDYYYL